MNTNFVDIAPDEFPFVISFYRHEDVEGHFPLFEADVTGPGALQIPALREPDGPPVWVRIRWADGTVSEYGKDQAASSDSET